MTVIADFVSLPLLNRYSHVVRTAVSQSVRVPRVRVCLSVCLSVMATSLWGP